MPVRKKLHMILIMAFLTQARSSRPIAIWTGTAVRVNLIMARRRLLCIKLPFQVGSLSAMLSIRHCQATLGRVMMDSGIPMYRNRNSKTEHGKYRAASSKWLASLLMSAI
jgi:hypothetical protein